MSPSDRPASFPTGAAAVRVLLVALIPLALGVAGCFTCGFSTVATCGDFSCGAGETCVSCPNDCGQCNPCGDGFCNATTESCLSCPTDCPCEAVCGDGFCDVPQGESCDFCPEDCGSCTVICGDGFCDADECFVCPTDCAGICGVCGDGFCDPGNGEDCDSCQVDCGLCGPTCGNGSCEMGEACDTCFADCSCPAPGFHEVFPPGTVDLSRANLRLTPAPGGGYDVVSGCGLELEEPPGSGSVSVVLPSFVGSSDPWPLPFPFSFFGTGGVVPYIDSNGSITFGVADGGGPPTVMNHYAFPRISPLMGDHFPFEVRVDEFADRVAFTWLVAGPSEPLGFQAVLNAGGEIVLSYDEVTGTLGPTLVGLSSGGIGVGLPVDASAGTCGEPWPSPGLFEQFPLGGNDLSNAQINFIYTPAGYVTFATRGHTTLSEGIGGGTLQSFFVSLLDDDAFEVPLVAPASFFGSFWGTVWIGSNGYLTFDGPDFGLSESPPSHFNQVRLSMLFDDLDPFGVGEIYFDEYPDRFVVTYIDVPQFGGIDSNTFQAVVRADGTLTITYLIVESGDGLVGLSDGNPFGLPLPTSIDLVP